MRIGAYPKLNAFCRLLLALLISSTVITPLYASIFQCPATFKPFEGKAVRARDGMKVQELGNGAAGVVYRITPKHGAPAIVKQYFTGYEFTQDQIAHKLLNHLLTFQPIRSLSVPVRVAKMYPTVDPRIYGFPVVNHLVMENVEGVTLSEYYRGLSREGREKFHDEFNRFTYELKGKMKKYNQSLRKKLGITVLASQIEAYNGIWQLRIIYNHKIPGTNRDVRVLIKLDNILLTPSGLVFIDPH